MPPALQGNRWLVLALGCLSLITTWSISQHLAAKAEALRLALFLVASAGYFLHSSGVFDGWYRHHWHRRYFFVQFGWLALLFLITRATAPIWVLALPLATQVVLYLPPKTLWPALLLLFFGSCFPLHTLHGNNLFFAALNILSSFVFTVGCSWAVRRERNTRAQLEAAHAQLQSYAEKAEAFAAAEERHRLAREIHDGAAHHLTAANVLLEAGRALLPNVTPEQVRDALQKAQSQIRAALTELRQSIEGRQPSSTAPLAERITALIADGDFPARLEIRGQPRRLSAAAEQALFRVAQEALTNARKHAPGASAELRLDYTAQQRTALLVQNDELSDHDSGDGAFGLLSLRQRMHQLGGTFRAGSEPTGRFVVQAEVPA